MDRGAWEATVHGITKSQTRLSDFPFFFSMVGQLHLSDFKTEISARRCKAVG